MTPSQLDNIIVSLYHGVGDTRGSAVTLANFLWSDMDHYAPIIDRIRATVDTDQQRRMKKSLPAATISATFSPARKRENVKELTHILCIDIDLKDNKHLTGFDDRVKALFWHCPGAFYLSHSCSGRGYFFLVELDAATDHRRAFNYVLLMADKRGIVIDRSCSDITRMRFKSYDNAAIFLTDKPALRLEPEPEAKPEVNTPAEPQTPHCTVSPIPHVPIAPAMHSEAERARRIAERLCRERRDITPDRKSWLRVCFALATLGEAGREIFHRVASLSPKYVFEENDRLFDDCLRRGSGPGSPVTFATFVYLARTA